MDEIEITAVIKYLKLKRLSTKQIHDDIMKTLGNEALSCNTVKKQAAELTRGIEGVLDEKGSERPKDVTTDENIEAVHKAVMNDGRLTIRYLAKTLEISFRSVYAILAEHLMMKSISASWVPRMLTEDQREKE